jgi:hypothetical protein
MKKFVITKLLHYVIDIIFHIIRFIWGYESHVRVEPVNL